jgi:hypothetical protein
MKKLVPILSILLMCNAYANSEWQFSSANKANTKNEYLNNMKKDRQGATVKVMNNVEESLLMQTRFMDSISKERFLARFNKLQGTNYSLKELERLSELYADRKQMATENNSKEAVVAYQFGSMEEREEALRQQAIRQQQTKQRANSVENDGLEFMKDLKSKNRSF